MYLQWAKERGAVIIEDDCDSDFSLTGSAPGTLFGMSDSGDLERSIGRLRRKRNVNEH